MKILRSIFKRMMAAKLDLVTIIFFLGLPILGAPAIQWLNHEVIHFVDAWFNNASAQYVTGLTSVDFSRFSRAARWLTAAYIEIGGLGVTWLSIFSMLAIRRAKESVKDRKLKGAELFRGFAEELGAYAIGMDWRQAKTLIKLSVAYTMIGQGVSTLILWWRFAQLGVGSALEHAGFHAISAWCNAGFSTFIDSLVRFRTDEVINGVISAEVFLGGIGFSVLAVFHCWFYEAWAQLRRWVGFPIRQGRLEAFRVLLGMVRAKQVALETALMGSFFGITIGTILPLVTEANHPDLQGVSLWGRTIIFASQTIWFATAGFASLDLAKCTPLYIAFVLGRMYVGAAGGGTAGGITYDVARKDWAHLAGVTRPKGQAILLRVFFWWKNPEALNLRDELRQSQEIVVELWKFSTIDSLEVRNAVRTNMTMMAFVAGAFLALLASEGSTFGSNDGRAPERLFFETVSAIGTVGSSMGAPGLVTSASGAFTKFGKIVMICVMAFGRVGPGPFLRLIFGHRKVIPEDQIELMKKYGL